MAATSTPPSTTSARFFLRYWQSSWGNPVSEEFYVVVDGVPMTHQMFEYALISHDPYTNEPLRSMRLTEVFLSAFDGGKGLGTARPVRALDALGRAERR